MKRSFFTMIVAAVAFAAPALALNNRSAVSVNGLDTNPCTTAGPCRSFTAAVAQTSPGGEVVALDTAGYGAFNITSSLTISGAPGVYAAITATGGTDAIDVNASGSDSVTIRNLILTGFKAANGIGAMSGADVRVLNCTITGFGVGILQHTQHMSVDGCVILDGTDGIDIVSNLAVVTQANVNDSLIEHNASDGILVASVVQNAFAAVTNCTVTDNGGPGIHATNSGIAVHVVVEKSTITYNPVGVKLEFTGMEILSAASFVDLSGNDIGFSPTGVELIGPAQFIDTYGNNLFTAVGTIGPLTPVSMH